MAFTPGHHPPVDPNVPIPAAVKALAAKSEAIHAAAYNSPPPQPDVTLPPQPATVQPPAATPAPQPATIQPPAPQPSLLQPGNSDSPQPQPQPQAPQPEQVGDAQTEHNRFLSMKGRYDQSQNTIVELQQQISALGGELMQWQSRANTQPPQPTIVHAPAQPLLTPEDAKTFGPELIDLVKRAATEAVTPFVAQVEQKANNLNQRFQQTSMQSLYDRLDHDLPDWRAINVNPRFQAWVALRDIYSGQVRKALLMDAFRQGNASRVLAFFKGFVSDEQATGQIPGSQSAPQETPARTAAIPLETLSTPGRVHPSGDQNLPTEQPVYTREQIRWFYSQAGRNAYIGRDADRARDETAIFSAQRAGRIVG